MAEIEARIDGDSPFADVIERAYRVFRRPGPTSTYACDCCWEPEIRADFVRHQPRDLSYYYLSEWFSAAVEPTLPQDFWAWLLPRILEVLASGVDPSNGGIEVSLYRYPTGDQKLWSKEEWAVLDAFQRLYLDRHPVIGAADHLDDVICMFANAGWPVEDLFAQIFAWPTERLAETLTYDWRASYGQSIWTTAFWDDESVPLAFWTSEDLYLRFAGYGLDDGNPIEMRDKALRLADAIEMSGGYWFAT